MTATVGMADREEILEQAEQTDGEDERYGAARGDELPEQLRTPEGRRAALQAVRERIQAEREAQQAAFVGPGGEGRHDREVLPRCGSAQPGRTTSGEQSPDALGITRGRSARGGLVSGRPEREAPRIDHSNEED